MAGTSLLPLPASFHSLLAGIYLAILEAAAGNLPASSHSAAVLQLVASIDDMLWAHPCNHLFVSTSSCWQPSHLLNLILQM